MEQKIDLRLPMIRTRDSRTAAVYHTVVCLKSGLACVGIFGESPDFLDKSFFAKIQKSGFLGKVLFFQNAKVRIFWKIAIFKKSAKARQNVESSGSKACGRLIN